MPPRSKKATASSCSSGRDKGKRGEVLTVMPKEDRAVVRGVNMVRRHQKQSADAAGRHHLERGADHICRTSRSQIPKDGKPTRVGFKMLADGTKVRVARRSGEVIPEKE